MNSSNTEMLNVNLLTAAHFALGRGKMEQIALHEYTRAWQSTADDTVDCKTSKKKLCRGDSEVCRTRERRNLLEGLVQSQPVTMQHCLTDTRPLVDSSPSATTLPQQQISFSQPEGVHDMLLPSQGFQLTQTQQTYLNPLQKLVKRMTRFFVMLSVEESVKELVKVLSKYSLDHRLLTTSCVSVETVDRRKSRLVFRAQVVEMEPGLTLLDFRLSRGCGLEFKKYFISIKLSLSEHLVSPPSWAACDLNQTK